MVAKWYSCVSFLNPFKVYGVNEYGKEISTVETDKLALDNIFVFFFNFYYLFTQIWRTR